MSPPDSRDARVDPFLIPAGELAPSTLTPADAPPPPEDEPGDAPEGAAMQAAMRLAARRRRGGGLFWAALGLFVSLVVSIATYDYLTSLLLRFPLPLNLRQLAPHVAPPIPVGGHLRRVDRDEQSGHQHEDDRIAHQQRQPEC